MRIPDGDLMPARRHRYGGGYRRRRRVRSRGMAVVLLVLVVVGALAWYLHREDGSPATQTLAPCPTPSPTATPAALPANGQVRLVLLNGTPRNGLAQQVGTQLRQRGFVVLRQDNAPAALAGPSVVSYGPGGLPAASVLARNVAGARVQAAPGARPGTVQLVLGGDFRRLATPAEVAAAAGPAVVPAAAPSGTRAPCAA